MPAPLQNIPLGGHVDLMCIYMSYANIDNLADTHQMDAIADEPTQPNEYREASLRYLHVMGAALDYITSNSSPHVASYAVALALGMPCARGLSMTDLSAEIGCGVAALSKQVRAFTDLAGIGESQYQYKKR